jgi:hypothetical protein
LVLVGCTAVDGREYARLAASFDAPAPVVRVMEHGEQLTLAEIGALAQAGMPAEEIIAYLRLAGKRYILTTREIDELRAWGVADSVIDCLLSTPETVKRAIHRPPRSFRPGVGYPSRGPAHRHR